MLTAWVLLHSGLGIGVFGEGVSVPLNVVPLPAGIMTMAGAAVKGIIAAGEGVLISRAADVGALETCMAGTGDGAVASLLSELLSSELLSELGFNLVAAVAVSAWMARPRRAARVTHLKAFGDILGVVVSRT